MPRRIRQDKMMRTLLFTFGILVVGLIVVLVLMLASGGQTVLTDEQMKTVEYVEGVSIAGVDVSGMTYEEASANAQIEAKAQAVAEAVTYTFTVEGKEYSLSGTDLGLKSNKENVLKEALYYGNTGDSGVQREQEIKARETGFDFALLPQADEAAVYEKLLAMKPDMDVLPQDAMLEISDELSGEERFTYMDEVKGIDVDIVQLATLMTTNINAGNMEAMVAPTVITQPAIDVKTLKANTKMIATYFSEFKEGSLSDPDRVTNIKILADIVNGTKIMPGDIWSINEVAGPRNEETMKKVGWKEAPGISNGRYEDQPGGGVCQVSSSVFNAAVRAELTIVERRPHSWPSGYIQKGMDATISTGGPDLKLSNPYDYPIYIAAFVDEEAFTVTVEIYGPPLPHGYTIDFESELIATYDAGEPIYHYDQLYDPEGDPIGEGKTITWKKERDGQRWRVFKVYLGPNGEKVKTEKFGEDVVYKTVTGEYYVNGSDPDLPPVQTPEA